MKSKLGIFLAVAFIFLIGATGAWADPISITYEFTSANVAFSGGAPYGYLTITADSDTGTVEFDITGTQATDLFLEFGFNSLLDTSAFSVTTKPANWDVGSGNMNGYGKFDVTVGSSAAADRVAEIIIIITTDNFADATLANFTVAADGGDESLFAAHLAQPGLTGFIGMTTQQVPDGGLTVMLLGLGVGGLALLSRKFRQ